MIPARALWFAFIVAVVGVAALALSGCTATAAYTGALKVKQVASDGLATAYDGWRAADKAAQDVMLGQSATYEQYQQKVGDWRRSAQNPVDDAFATARDALASFSNALTAAGAARVKDYGDAIGHLVQAFLTLQAILSKYGVTLKLPTLSQAARVAVQLYAGGFAWVL